MIQLKAIDHINMNVRDISETINFYKNLFAFEVYEEGSYGDEPYAIIGKKNIAYLCIYQDKELSVENNTISHLGFHVNNFEQVKSVLADQGVPIGLEYDYPKLKSIYIHDPNGYEIEISERMGGAVHEN